MKPRQLLVINVHKTIVSHFSIVQSFSITVALKFYFFQLVIHVNEEKCRSSEQKEEKNQIDCVTQSSQQLTAKALASFFYVFTSFVTSHDSIVPLTMSVERLTLNEKLSHATFMLNCQSLLCSLLFYDYIQLHLLRSLLAVACSSRCKKARCVSCIPSSPMLLNIWKRLVCS